MRKKQVDPAPSLLMVLVRHLKGWFEKGELARILGVTPSQVTMWERRDRAVPRGVLERTFDKAEIPRSLIAPALRTIRAFLRAAQGRSRPERASGVALAADTLPFLLSVADLVLEPFSRSQWDRPSRSTADDRIEAEELWVRLKRRSAADRRVLVEDGRDYQSWGLCEKAAAESRAAAESAPREALEWAELAIHIAEHIPGKAGWRRRVEELLDPAVVARMGTG
jgi:hypothetical protein